MFMKKTQPIGLRQCAQVLDIAPVWRDECDARLLQLTYRVVVEAQRAGVSTAGAGQRKRARGLRS